MKAIGLARSPAKQVELLARMGVKAGIHGFVCSPLEVAALRGLTGEKGVLVVPGIRPQGAEAGDQKRLATPADALRDGASYLVVGLADHASYFRPGQGGSSRARRRW